MESVGRAGGWEKMPAGAGRQLDGREEMGEDASWSLELVDSWTGGKRWEMMPAGAGRQLFWRVLQV